jgi:hypothetical protein
MSQGSVCHLRAGADVTLWLIEGFPEFPISSEFLNQDRIGNKWAPAAVYPVATRLSRDRPWHLITAMANHEEHFK